MRILAGLVLALLLVAGLGCSRKPVLAPDSDFSINVLLTPSWWPREKQDWSSEPVTAAVQQEYYALHGRPEVLRVVWNRDRSLIRQAEMADRVMKNKNKPVEPPEFEWIYLERGIVARFHRDRVEERPLDDRLRAVALYGDPNEWKVNRDAAGRDIETYIYYNQGTIMTFLREDGRKLREERFQPTHRYQRRM